MTGEESEKTTRKGDKRLQIYGHVWFLVRKLLRVEHKGQNFRFERIG